MHEGVKSICTTESEVGEQMYTLIKNVYRLGGKKTACWHHNEIKLFCFGITCL